MTNYRRCTKSKRCPLCENESGCAVSVDGSAVMCLRASSGAYKLKDGMGWLVRLNGDKPAPRQLPKRDEHLTLSECKAIQARFFTAVNPEKLELLATQLGLTVKVLKNFGVGWDNVWTFPMRDGQRRIIGFRTRDADGNKRSLKGSANGLFIPDDLDLMYRQDMVDFDPELLLLPEGPTDAAAATQLGFGAIGRPSNTGGADKLAELLSTAEKRDVVIVADHDPVHKLKDGTPFVPGWEGALALAAKILPFCGTLRMLRPPGNLKDLRKWMIDGGQAMLMRSLINDTEPMTTVLLKEKQKRIDEWKKAARDKQNSPNGSGGSREPAGSVQG